MLSERTRKYIHFEVPPEAIFNPDRWNFRQVVRLDSWQSEGDRVILKLVLSDGSKADLEIFGWSEEVLRFRFGAPGTAFPSSSEMIVGQPRPTALHGKATAERLKIGTTALTLEISPEPWGFRILDRRGRLLQRTHDSGPLKTFFPLYSLGLQDQVGGSRTRVFASFDLEPQEAVYGCGEKFGPLNKRGQRISSWNSDTTNCSTDRSYKNIPFLMTTSGYGLFLHDSHRIEYEIGSWSHTALSFAVENAQLEWFFLNGPSLKEILARYTELTGRPPVPPLWSFGLWMSRCAYRNRKEFEQVAQELRRRRIPCDVLHLDPWWMREGHFADFEWDTDAFPKPQEMIAHLEAEGFKVCLWEQPYVPVGTEAFREGEAKGYFVRDGNGKTLLIPDFLDSDVAIVDFTNPGAREWYQSKHRALLEMGIATFKTDMGEAVPREAVFADGRSGAEMHNLYPLLYQETVWKTVAEKWQGRGLIWGRSGYAGCQRYPTHWGGDSVSTPGEMMAVLRGGLSFGLSGGPFWSQDIGGFQGTKPEPWLYVRWAQWGMFNSHSRCHGVQPREPWEFGAEAEAIFRRYAELRYRLLPYIWSVAHEASRTGLPVMRPLVLEFQDDPTTWHVDTEYLFGPWLLVIPIFDETGLATYYLPPGKWLDYWHDRVLTGPTWRTETFPLEEMPVFVRDGALIGKAPLMQYVGQRPWDELGLEVFLTSGRSQTLLVDDRGQEISVEGWWSGNRAGLRWSGSGVPVEILWRDLAGPAAVELRGEKLPEHLERVGIRWEYDPKLRRLTIHVPAGHDAWELEIRFE